MVVFFQRLAVILPVMGVAVHGLSSISMERLMAIQGRGAAEAEGHQGRTINKQRQR